MLEMLASKNNQSVIGNNLPNFSTEIYKYYQSLNKFLFDNQALELSACISINFTQNHFKVK